MELPLVVFKHLFDSQNFKIGNKSQSAFNFQPSMDPLQVVHAPLAPERSLTPDVCRVAKKREITCEFSGRTFMTT